MQNSREQQEQIKTFLNEKGKKKKQRTIEWQRLGDLSKKIGDTKRIFHAKMGTIKDRNGMDLTEAEDIKKRWQEQTEEPYKKIFMTQISIVL